MTNRRDPTASDELELDWKGRENRAQDAGMALPSAMANVGDVEGQAGKGPPGDPRYMSLQLRLALTGLFESPSVRMRQLREVLEMLVGWETRNRYEVCDDTGRVVTYVGESGDGWGSALMRNFWPFRTVRLECMTAGGTMALTVEKPWRFFFARAEVKAWDGRELGAIEQRFSFLGRRLALLSPGGAEIATLEGPLLKPWTFRVMQRGVEVAVIRKRWSGLLTEMMTDADTFTLEFGPECNDARLRQLLLGAALLVDLTYFENRSGSGNRANPLGLLSSFFD